MKDQQGASASDRDHAIAALNELIDALDRRVPHVERVGEIRIAREAETLRKDASRELMSWKVPRQVSVRVTPSSRTRSWLTTVDRHAKMRRDAVRALSSRGH